MTTLGLGLNLGSKNANRSPFPGASIYLDAANLLSGISNTQWKDLATGTIWTVTNGTLANGQYQFSSTGFAKPPANYGGLQHLHKTLAGFNYTLAIGGTTTTTDARWIAGSHNSTAATNGLGIRYQGDAEIDIFQYTGGTGAQSEPEIVIPNSSDFLLIVAHDESNGNINITANSYIGTELAEGWNANLNDAQGVFTLGGLPNTGNFVGNIDFFMLIPRYADKDLIADITLHYEEIRSQRYGEIVVGWMGQSNSDKMFTDYSGAGNTEFVSVLEAATGAEVLSYNGATSGSALLEANENGSGYWIASDGSAGDVFDTLETALDSAGVSKKAVSYLIGTGHQTDCNLFGATDSAANYSAYKTGLEQRSALYAAHFPNAKEIWIDTLKDTDSNNFGGFRDGKRATLEWLSENANVYYAPTSAYLTRQDDAHLDQAGYEDQANNAANVINGIESGDLSETQGPYISAATFTNASTSVVLTVTQDGGVLGTAPSFEAGYWGIIRNGTVIGVSAAARTNDNTITLTSAQALATGDTVIVLHHNGPLKNTEPTSTDSTNKHWMSTGTPALPLRPARIQASVA